MRPLQLHRSLSTRIVFPWVYIQHYICMYMYIHIYYVEKNRVVEGKLKLIQGKFKYLS